MPFISAQFHLVWSTKNRFPFLETLELREKVFNHIRENAKEKGIWLDRVNGHKDHIHCILSLGAEQTISKTVQLIKGESSYWINKNKLSRYPFRWQDEYYATSVNISDLVRLRPYIDNQEEHHKKKSFKEEIEEIEKKYGFK